MLNVSRKPKGIFYFTFEKSNMAFSGLEPIFRCSQPLKKKQDCLIVFIHWKLVKNNFLSLSDPSPINQVKLPIRWIEIVYAIFYINKLYFIMYIPLFLGVSKARATWKQQPQWTSSPRLEWTTWWCLWDPLHEERKNISHESHQRGWAVDHHYCGIFFIFSLCKIHASFYIHVGAEICNECACLCFAAPWGWKGLQLDSGCWLMHWWKLSILPNCIQR